MQFYGHNDFQVHTQACGHLMGVGGACRQRLTRSHLQAQKEAGFFIKPPQSTGLILDLKGGRSHVQMQQDPPRMTRPLLQNCFSEWQLSGELELGRVHCIAGW